MKKFLLALSFVSLTGCSTIVGFIPSFWDDNQSVADWANRSAVKEGSEAYCNLKKRTLKLQAERAATAILGRY